MDNQLEKAQKQEEAKKLFDTPDEINPPKEINDIINQICNITNQVTFSSADSKLCDELQQIFVSYYKSHVKCTHMECPANMICKDAKLKNFLNAKLACYLPSVWVEYSLYEHWGYIYLLLPNNIILEFEFPMEEDFKFHKAEDADKVVKETKKWAKQNLDSEYELWR